MISFIFAEEMHGIFVTPRELSRLSSVLGGTIAKMNKPGADDGGASSAVLELPHFFASPFGVGGAVSLLEICMSILSLSTYRVVLFFLGGCPLQSKRCLAAAGFEPRKNWVGFSIQNLIPPHTCPHSRTHARINAHARAYILLCVHTFPVTAIYILKAKAESAT